MVSTDLIVYGDYMSQPSRAVFAFCLLNKIPHQVQIVSVVAMDQYSAEFKAVNPNAKVPAISDNGLKLFESNTILRYLHDTRKCADHWYPKEERARAKVEEYLQWHHNNIRLGAGGYFFRKFFSANTGKPAPYLLVQESWEIMVKSTKYIEEYWLNGFGVSKQFMFGNEPTIADL